VLSPTSSPDGSKIAAVRETARVPTPRRVIVLLDADGRPARVLEATQAESISQPRWSADGRHLVYSAGQAGRQHIYLVALEDGTPVQLTTGDSDDVDPDFWGTAP
jgi:Tol biopolymer transport system component